MSQTTQTCNCGAASDGKWAGIHTQGCAALTEQGLSADEERFLRFMDCFRNEVPAKQMRPNLAAECVTCIANGYVSFDGSTYRTTPLGRQKIASIPVLPIIDLVAMKEYERWHGLDHSLGFQTQHDTAAAWAAQRDFTFDKRTWTEVET